jgi:apolipoprotein D and lipocalin family protein
MPKFISLVPLAFCSVFFSVMGSMASSRAPELRTVPQVDLKQYMGTWYEIAAIPQKFEKDCSRSTQALYHLLEDGAVSVVNSCVKSNGEPKVAEGRAKVVDPLTQAKLKVTFVKLIDWVFAFGGDYWIIDLAPDYSYAVVGHPNRTYGWILSRRSSLPIGILKKISQGLIANGYDPCRFLTTPQDGGINQKISICNL